MVPIAPRTCSINDDVNVKTPPPLVTAVKCRLCIDPHPPSRDSAHMTACLPNPLLLCVVQSSRSNRKCGPSHQSAFLFGAVAAVHFVRRSMKSDIGLLYCMKAFSQAYSFDQYRSVQWFASQALDAIVKIFEIYKVVMIQKKHLPHVVQRLLLTLFYYCFLLASFYSYFTCILILCRCVLSFCVINEYVCMYMYYKIRNKCVQQRERLHGSNILSSIQYHHQRYVAYLVYSTRAAAGKMVKW